MRRSNSALPTRDACRALWQQQQQQQQQRRALCSAALNPGYSWPGSSSTAASAPNSSSTPLSFTISTAASSSKSKVSRPPRPLFAFAYSTSNPAYPLPGSNNDIDPRGVDYSLFEAEDDTYSQHASTSATADTASTSRQTDTSAVTAVEATSTLSAPTQLLVRLIKEQDFEAANTVLQELHVLQTPLEERHAIFSTAALWAIRNGKKQDMLKWMRLCPGYAPGSKYLETASSASYADQVRSIAINFRKCFMVLLDSYGDDTRLLQRASMIAAKKGMWSVLQSTLAQILRFGAGRASDSETSNPELAYQYFDRLVQASLSYRGLKGEERRKAILSSTDPLRGLYNLAIRTLALAGRLDDAVHWAEKSAEVNDPALWQIVRLEPFTETLLMEELARAGSCYVDQARSLADKLARAPTRSMKHRAVDVDAIVKRIERETAFTSSENETNYASRSGSPLDNTIRAHLQQGDVVSARDHLLSVLRSARRVRRADDDPSSALDLPVADGASALAHLPSARVLSELQDLANKLGTVVVTSSLTENDMHHSSETPSQQESLTAEEFLRPLRGALLGVRAGKGLWETARLYGYVQKGKFKEAIQFYVGRAGFRLPSGGITVELVSLVLDQQTLPKSKRETTDKATGFRGKHWPSTHAINLMLKAIAGVCVDAQDYSRLTQAYNMWKASSLPSSSTARSPEEDGQEEEQELVFEQWPPSQRPDSHTFDPFLRAFGRLTIEVQPTASKEASVPAKVEKQEWGSSQALLDVIRDMTDTFLVRPSVSTWTITLECLAREGRERWATTTNVLARAVGINTISPLSLSSASADVPTVTGPQDSFPAANLVTYTALIHALIRVPHQDGGSMVDEAAAVRDDLLWRTLDLDVAARNLVLAEREEADGGSTFWHDLLARWQALQQEPLRGDSRERWEASHVLNGNDGRTTEALRELWMLESARSEADTDAL